ncbi:hypothetical protein AX15_000053 [Amanita polypyramis BW_CC]|nr:hypothetical protein AX15_000053 [Amanita polypyramis BW_CC]
MVHDAGDGTSQQATPLLSAASCSQSYVSVTQDQGSTSSTRRRNSRHFGVAMRMGKETTSEHGSIATGPDTRTSCPSLSTMNATETAKGPCDPKPLSAPAGLVSKVSLTLQNSGSVARDHLALERTFLAYLRTSLAIVTAGVALVQLFISASATSDDSHMAAVQRLHISVRALGASSIILGLVILITGVIRYFSIQNALTTGMFPTARLSTCMIAMAVTILITVTLGIVMMGRLEA